MLAGTPIHNSDAGRPFRNAVPVRPCATSGDAAPGRGTKHIPVPVAISLTWTAVYTLDEAFSRHILPVLANPAHTLADVPSEGNGMVRVSATARYEETALVAARLRRPSHGDRTAPVLRERMRMTAAGMAASYGLLVSSAA